MLHENCYISCNCNQTPTAAHWGRNGLICYASCSAVMIYDPKAGAGGKVVASLVFHNKRVNSVRWLQGDDAESEMVSGSSDHTAIVWTCKKGKYSPSVLTGHNSNVNIVDGLYKSSRRNHAVVVTVSMDSTVKIWTRIAPTDDFILSQTLNYGYSVCVAVRISFLDPSTLILACAVDNSNIQLYIENDLEFTHAAALKGHEDWVRGLDFTTDEKGDVILASSSQDLYIRLWRITKNLHNETPDTYLIKSGASEYRVYIDSILTGHEGWIYSVNWGQKGQLLSASLDKSMIIWELDPESKLWLEKICVGEVGGNTLGFYGGVFGPEGDAILAHSYHGAFHIWRKNDGNWEPSVTVGGHFGEVTDLGWEPQGEFVVSVSTDQTTRIHAPWPHADTVTWHEIARPQVHGYDLSSIAILSRYKFASSAEEKVVRTFQAPSNFIENFSRICKIDETDDFAGQDCGPKGAAVPSLGLSNKAVFTIENKVKTSRDSYLEESEFTAVTLTEPPTEETLLQNTLWPEIQKLYGHGYEVYTLASSPDGKLLASACKATTPEHAAVLLWDTTDWLQVQKLTSHTLTVAQMAFSPDSRHLLTVSRDRRWSLFSKNVDRFQLVATTDKKTSIHTRIIWCCGWSHDSKYFTTGSRDGKVVVWTKNKQIKDGVLGEYGAASKHLELKGESVTAVAFAPCLVENSYLVSIGFESGVILFYKWGTDSWEQVLVLDRSLGHHLTVKRLAFRPVPGRAGYKERSSANVLQLASCGADHSVRIYDIIIK